MAAHETALMIPLAAILAPMAIALVYVVLNAVSKTICHWRDVSLKIRLAEQGLSSDEIERIVIAGRGTSMRACKTMRSGKYATENTQSSAMGKPPIKPKPMHTL